MSTSHEQTTASNLATTDPAARTADRLRRLMQYGPVRIVTREPGYSESKGARPLPTDPDGRRRFFLGQTALHLEDTGEDISVTVDTPLGPRLLPLDKIERVGVDNPFGGDMPLHGRQMYSSVLMPYDGHENVLRWPPRAYETFYGGHRYSVHEANDRTENNTVGTVRAYDISAPSSGAPWARDTSLEAAIEAERPYGTYYISALGVAGTAASLTVVTSRMGYTAEGDRVATILRPNQVRVPERSFDMFDAVGRHDDEVHGLHLDRVAQLAEQHGPAAPLRQIDVDAAFLYMTHD